MDRNQSKSGRKKKKRTFNFSRKQKFTSESTTSSATDDVTATATTQRIPERDCNALTTELRELYDTPVWGGRQKQISKVPISKVNKIGLGEAANQTKKTSGHDKSDLGNLVKNYASLKSNVENNL